MSAACPANLILFEWVSHPNNTPYTVAQKPPDATCNTVTQAQQFMPCEHYKGNVKLSSPLNRPRR